MQIQIAINVCERLYFFIIFFDIIYSFIIETLVINKNGYKILFIYKYYKRTKEK